MPPYLISATVIGVLAQRLTRSLCPACRAPDTGMGREAMDELAKPWHINKNPRAYKAVGCPKCRQTGYRGRAALYELMVVSEPLRTAMHPQLDEAKLRRAAAQNGLRPLRVAGLAKVAEGATSLDEVLRCTPRWENS